MQTLTDAQRALLTGNRVEVTAGCKVLNLDLTVLDDVSDDLVGGSVARNMDARIHGTCSLQLSTELEWGNVLVRPYMTLSDGGVSETFNVGVFALTTPERTIGETPVTLSVSGADRLYLLDREVGASYTIASGTTYYDALVDVFGDAGLSGFLIDGAADDYTLPVARTWALVASSTDPDQTNTPVTWLRVVNDLQQAWNGRGVWADHDGLFRCQQYQAPSDRAPEFTFDADDPTVSIVGEQRTVIVDQWKTPNRWVFRWTNRPGGMSGVEGVGIHTYDLPDDDPMSEFNRGLVWTKVVDYEAASFAVLEELGDRRVAADRRVTSSLRLTTAPFPAAGHADVATLVDAAAGGNLKVQATDWSMDLLGGDMSWSWEEVV